jgi:hypothetical protein
LFCGRGGARASARFRHDFHVSGHAMSRAEAEGLMAQEDLFDGAAVRAKWIARLDAHAPRRRAKAVA